MDVKNTHEDQLQEVLCDDEAKGIWAEISTGRDNGIDKLEQVQEHTPDVNSGCQSALPEEKDEKKHEISDSPSKIERDSLEREVSSTKSAQNQSALAFTIDFGGNKEIESTKYQNLFQRYNARHKRNFSTSKIEIKSKKPAEDLSPNFVQKHKPLSIHSEGYFSSEDDSKRKVDRLSQKLRELGVKSTLKGATRKSDTTTASENRQQNPKRRSYHEESMQSNCMSSEMTYSATMNDLSKMQSSLEENRNRVQYSPEKNYTKNIEYIEIHHDYAEEIEKSSRDMTEKLLNMSCLSDNYPSTDGATSSCTSRTNVQSLSVSYTAESGSDLGKANLDVFNVSNIDGGSDGTVSEAGTYTVHKDYTDEEKARMDIDKVFSVGVLTEEETNELYVHHFKMRSSRDTNTWISEWATQVAEHNSLPPSIGGSTGRTPPMSPTKIPSPIYSRSQRGIRGRYEQSDSSLDAEIQQMRGRIESTATQHAVIDSGGDESDEDTSNSYNTPPHSSQRTPTHGDLIRRGSLTESLFKRVNNSDVRRSMRKYSDAKKKEEIAVSVPKSPSYALARLNLERSSSSDRRSDTADSNSSRRSSVQHYADEYFKHTNSPILNRLRPSTPKLTNSPILSHKTITSKMIDSPTFDRPKQLLKSNSPVKNIGYYTCMESSPYMLRKSLSTSNYREDTSTGIKDFMLQNSPVLQRNINIQRSASNTSIRNAKTKNSLTRRSSFNDHGGSREMNAGNMVSDSSSEAGEPATCPAPLISSGIRLNRAFSIRRARVNCDSDTTPNRTPEERRRKAQTEVKSAPTSARQSGQPYRARISSVGASSRDTAKKAEVSRLRGPSLTRNEGGRYSMKSPKTSNSTSLRPNQKVSNNNNNNNNNNRESKTSGRSNSSLTSKEVEFQNWKRRKSYDPMKAAAEGKKKLDNSRKNHSTDDGSTSRDNSSVLRSASFHGTGGALALADDWSDNKCNLMEPKEIIQIPPPCSPLGSDSDLDTSCYLQATQNVMSSMSARITVYRPPPVDSGGESDDDTSHSLRQMSKATRNPSDTESSDEPQVAPSSSGSKFNRVFELRRGRDAEEARKVSVAKPKVSAVNSKPKTESGSIARTDSGRFSMRLSKSTGNTQKTKPKDPKKLLAQHAKEQELQNWKRRKNYDPMKAALEGKRKAAGLTKKNLYSESSSVLRSQSFHGPVNFGISEWSDEDISVSADEAPMF